MSSATPKNTTVQEVKPKENKTQTKKENTLHNLETKRATLEFTAHAVPAVTNMGCIGELCAIQGGKRRTNRKVKKSRKTRRNN